MEWWLKLLPTVTVSSFVAAAIVITAPHGLYA